MLLLQIGHKIRTLRYRTISLNINLSTDEYDRIANDLDNICCCISNEIYSDQSIECRIKAANLFKENNNKKREAKQYHNLVVSFVKKKDYDNAEKYAREGLIIYRTEGKDGDLLKALQIWQMFYS